MASTPATPATAGGSQGSNSSLPSSTPSSPSSLHDTASHGDDASAGVSAKMLREEERMLAASQKDEERRMKKAEKDLQRDIAGGSEVSDTKMKQLEFLLSKSKIFASVMMAEMQKSTAKDNAREAGAAKRAQKREDQAEKSATASQRKSTRAATGSINEVSNDGLPADQRTDQEASKARSMPTRTKAKNGGDGSITKYLKKQELQAKAGETSVAQALEEAALEHEVSGDTLGAQNLRSARQPALVSGGLMRNYQLEGLEWLTSLYENGMNGILADEMGLGKTIQTISFLAFLREREVYGPFLIAAPLSTLSNWVEEFARWTPKIPVVLYHGPKVDRQVMRQKKFRLDRKETFPVVCTSYEICMNDQKFLSQYGWKYIIIDEGHRIKNLNCRLVRELKSYTSANRLLITGTPLQNNLAELWSLLNFLMPDVFTDVEAFESWFDFSDLQKRGGHEQILNESKRSNLISSIHAILKPFLLRRVKTDVETSLPKKREYILYAPLSATQKELYKVILEGNSRSYLEDKAIERIACSGATTPKSTRSSSLKRKSDSETATPNKSAKSSRASTPASSLRGRKTGKQQDYKELSDHEYFKKLEAGSESEELDEEEQEEQQRAKTIALAKKEVANKKLQNPVMQLRLTCNSPHNFYWPWEGDDVPDDTLISESGKMILLERLIPYLFSKGHKVLLFSQFKTQLDIIEEWASLIHDWNICRIDGQVKQDDRRQQIKAFNEDPDYKLFLLSTRAGGQGINLAAADTVILFDSDWNPQQDLQAQDRAHRIGQTRPVIVYRLATKGTVEQTLLEKADGKRRLEKLVIQKGKFRSMINKSREDMDELQKILSEDDFEKYDLGTNAEILSDRDLEVLTDRSEEAYTRAEKGLDAGDTFKTVETKKEGESLVGQLSK
ncbi:MAG: hypothetical protein M1827_005202 [Pycnora praestabilis]|nr:MAG: hypothetical protein M1827_005202 [Pycnora praestabilis]